jgi:hypothetical protein
MDVIIRLPRSSTGAGCGVLAATVSVPFKLSQLKRYLSAEFQATQEKSIASGDFYCVKSTDHRIENGMRT